LRISVGYLGFQRESTRGFGIEGREGVVGVFGEGFGEGMGGVWRWGRWGDGMGVRC